MSKVYAFKDKILLNNNIGIASLNSGIRSNFVVVSSGTTFVSAVSGYDFRINNNITNSTLYLNNSGGNPVIIGSKLGVNLTSSSLISANLTMPQNSYIGTQSTLGNNSAYFGIAGGYNFDCTSASRIALFGNETPGSAGNLNIYAGNNTFGSIQLYTGMDSLKMQILNSGSALFSPNGSTIVVNINSTNSSFNTPVLLNSGATISSLFSTNQIITNSSITNALITNASIAGIALTTATIPSLNSTNFVSTNISTSSINILGGITSANALITNSTITNAFVTNQTIGNLGVNNLILGVSSIFSGSYIAFNNSPTPINVTNLVFNSSLICGFTIILTATITAGANNYFETFTIRGSEINTGWSITTTSIGDSSGIVFSITSGGQIQYTSTDFPSYTSSVFRYNVTQISNTGTYSSLNNFTSGTYIIDSLVITNTNSSLIASGSGVFPLASIGNLYSTNSSLSTLNISTGITSLNALITIATIPTLVTNTLNSTAQCTFGNTLITGTLNSPSQCTFGNTQVQGTFTLSNNLIQNNSQSGTLGNLKVTSLVTPSFVATNSSTNNLIVTDITTSTLLSTSIKSGNVNTLGSIITSSVNIGIGVTQANATLHIKDTVANSASLLLQGSTGNDQFKIALGTTNTILTAGGGDLHFASSLTGQGVNTSATIVMTLQSAGNIGINTTSPSFNLDVTGTGRLTIGITTGTILTTNTSQSIGVGTGGSFTSLGGGSFGKDLYVGGTVFSSSDFRLKENIVELGGDYLNKIREIRTVKYNMISDPKKIQQYGFIAQDFESSLSEMITRSNENAMYALDYPKMAVVLLKCIKELESRLVLLEEWNKK